MPLPCRHFRPASITSHLELSIMIGTRAISGSLATRFRKRTIAALLSSIASSMLTSMTWAPFSTCWRATDSAASKSPARIIRAKAFEPVTLVRSPMLTNRWPSPKVTGSSPDRRIGGTGVRPANAGSAGSAASSFMSGSSKPGPAAPRPTRGARCPGGGERRCRPGVMPRLPEPGGGPHRAAVATLLGNARILGGGLRHALL